ncbi:phage tail tape measure protein [Clostridium brassicae]|uniref:Phage tail tape measure protein n=1 Tax=Clostridium brassicae TaxID=2999072 RepID=A0ABT4D7Z8_9CLOT|nr:phage tail tape measure protein [Clostridium brassicae]MCY6958283.1 phage tail tape measure protein [Clostridium brassicae]
MGKSFGIKTKIQLDLNSVNQVKREFSNLNKDLQNLADRNFINIRVNQANQEIQRFSTQMSNTRTSINNVNNAICGLNNSSRTFAQQMTHVVSKVSQWALGMTAVYGTTQKVKEGFSFISNLDTKLTDIGMITGKSKEELNEYAKKWNQLALDLKTVTTEVVDAEEKFLRAGKAIDEANKMTDISIKMARIANDTNAQTADYLVTVSNAYDLNAQGVEKYANKVAYLDSATATNTKNINKTSVAVAQTAKETGMSMDFMLGIVSTIQEKSKLAPEAVGRALRSMLINMQNVTKEGNEELSKLEKILNKNGIALRKNKNEWRSSEAVIRDLMKNWNKFDDITKSTIQSKLAGKVGSETFNIIMNDQTRVMENYNNVLGATSTLNEKYEKHLNSTAGAAAELQAKTERMWMKLIDSKTIMNGINLLSKVVTIIDELVNHNKLLGVGLIALTAQFVGLIKGVNLFGMALTALKGISLATLGALATNPLTWVAVAIGGVIALTNHLAKQREETEKLKKEYKEIYTNLNKAIKTGNTIGMKDNVDKLAKEQQQLQELIKKRKQAQESLTTMHNGGMVGTKAYGDTAKEVDKLTQQLNELKNVLKSAGVEFDETTGKIYKVGQAQAFLANQAIVDKIKETAQAELENRKELIALIQEYQRLSQSENQNWETKQRLTELTQILNNKISGLIVARDKEGNATIKNTDLLKAENKILNIENTTVQELTNVKLNSAKKWAEAEIGKTKASYENAQKRIAYMVKEVEVMRNAVTGASAFSNIMTAMSTLNPNMMGVGSVVGGAFDAVYNQKMQELSNLKSIISQIDGQFKEIPMPKLPDPSSSSWMPPSGSDSKKGSKDKKDKEPTKHFYDGKPLDLYEAKLKDINKQLENYGLMMDRLTKLTAKLQEAQTKDVYSRILDTQAQKVDTLHKKQELLKGQQADLIKTRNSKIIDQLQKMSGDLRKKHVNDIARMTETDWANQYNKMYGREKPEFTGYDEKGEARQKLLEENAQKFKSLMDNLNNYNKELQKKEQEILDNEVDITNAVKERVEWQEKLRELTTKELVDKTGDIQDKIDLLEIKDKYNWQERIKLHKELLESQKAEQNFIKDGIEKYKIQLSHLRENTVEWSLIKNLIEEYNEKLDESNKIIATQEEKLKEVEKMQLENLSTIEDKIVSALKKKYEEEIKLAKEKKAKELLLQKNLTEEQLKLIKDGSKTALEIFEEEHNKKIELLNDELKAYEEIYNAKIKEIDRAEDKDSYEKDLNKKQQEKAKLQSQYDSLLMDSSLEAQGKREDLLEQIKNKEEEINEFVHKRDVTLRKQNLQDELEEKKKAIQKQIDEENKAYKKAKDLYDQEVKALEKSNEEKLKAEKLYAEARRLLMEGNLDELKVLLEQYGEDSERIFGSMGDSIKKNIIDNLRIAIDSMKELANSKLFPDWEGRQTDENGNQIMRDKPAVSKDKQWTIKMNKEIDEKTLKDKVYVLDEKGNKVDIDVSLDGNGKNIVVKPTGEGFEKGHYQLVVEKGLKSKDGKELKTPSVRQEFDVNETGGKNHYNQANRDKIDDFYTDPEYLKLQQEYLDSLENPKLQKPDSYWKERSEEIRQKYKTNIPQIPQVPMSAFSGDNMPQFEEYLSSSLNKIKMPTINIPTNFNIPKFSAVGNTPVEIKMDNLINIEGNADKSTLPEIRQAGQNTLEQLRQALNKQGIGGVFA